jgi:triosephosphate isomerase (TIM)
MRRPIIAGNWKMHMTNAAATRFVEALRPELAAFSAIELVVCPPFTALEPVSNALAGSDIAVGAQNMHWEDEGAFTSQISPLMLRDLAKYVVLGHSECRAYLHETDEMINRKVQAALRNNLVPILAVGENLGQNEAGKTVQVVREQVMRGLDGLDVGAVNRVVVAYEPIWAIGTGRNASAEQVDDTIQDAIRGAIRTEFGPENAEIVRVQYGGSVKPDNMEAYMRMPNIDGALVGGASLDVTAFSQLVQLAAKAKGL